MNHYLRLVFFFLCSLAAASAGAVDMPPNAELDYTGKRWQCIRGYFQAGNECRRVEIPENAELDYTGHRWQCRRGFSQVGNRCEVVRLPENAELDCRRGVRSMQARSQV